MEEMYLLNTYLEKLNSRDKIFMLNLIYKDGIRVDYQISVKELSGRFTFPEAMIKASLTSLVKQGFLQKYKVDSKNYHYKFSSNTAATRMRDRHYSQSNTEKKLTPLQAFCLYSESAEEGRGLVVGEKEHVNKLSYAGRLILFWFLIHEGENVSSIVINPGTKLLSEFAGVGADGVRNQVQKLIGLGALVQLTSGFTGKHLYGVMNNVFVIALTEEKKQLVWQYNRLLNLFLDTCDYHKTIDDIFMRYSFRSMNNQESEGAFENVRSDLMRPVVYKHLVTQIILSYINSPKSTLVYSKNICFLSAAYQNSLGECDPESSRNNINKCIADVVEALDLSLREAIDALNGW